MYLKLLRFCTLIRMLNKGAIELLALVKRSSSSTTKKACYYFGSVLALVAPSNFNYDLWHAQEHAASYSHALLPCCCLLFIFLDVFVANYVASRTKRKRRRRLNPKKHNSHSFFARLDEYGAVIMYYVKIEKLGRFQNNSIRLNVWWGRAYWPSSLAICFCMEM